MEEALVFRIFTYKSIFVKSTLKIHFPARKRPVRERSGAGTLPVRAMGKSPRRRLSDSAWHRPGPAPSWSHGRDRTTRPGCDNERRGFPRSRGDGRFVPAAGVGETGFAGLHRGFPEDLVATTDPIPVPSSPGGRPWSPGAGSPGQVRVAPRRRAVGEKTPRFSRFTPVIRTALNFF